MWFDNGSLLSSRAGLPRKCPLRGQVCPGSLGPREANPAPRPSGQNHSESVAPWSWACGEVGLSVLLVTTVTPIHVSPQIYESWIRDAWNPVERARPWSLARRLTSSGAAPTIPAAPEGNERSARIAEPLALSSYAPAGPSSDRFRHRRSDLADVGTARWRACDGPLGREDGSFRRGCRDGRQPNADASELGCRTITRTIANAARLRLAGPRVIARANGDADVFQPGRSESTTRARGANPSPSAPADARPDTEADPSAPADSAGNWPDVRLGHRGRRPGQ
jgi:hypothetical protein